MTAQPTANRAEAFEEVSLYAKRENIYQKEVRGRFQTLRAGTLFVLAAVFLAGPWWRWGDRQAIWLDLPVRRFHFFGLTFWPQDFILLSWLLITGAFGLFFFTNLAGRLWCGYACPQTVWTKFFMWAEWLAEGDRNRRILLDRAKWTAEKLLRKLAKHGLWLGLALAVAVTCVGYFTPIRELIVAAVRFDLGPAPSVAVMLLATALYLDAGWMREQICKYACPYARFQGAMFDSSTLTVFYDRSRGEPRGHRRHDAETAAPGLGDCVDCGLCFHVCPTGIDIRNGTQYECIGCAACIDACDEVMDKVGFDRGLVRYSTEDALAGGRTSLLRPRLLAYGAVFALMLGTVTYGLATRVPLELDVIRERGRLYRETSDGGIENVYRLVVLNMDQHTHSYELRASGIAELQVEGPALVEVAAGAIANVPIRLRTAASVAPPGSTPIRFSVRAVGDARLVADAESRFVAPSTEAEDAR
jgi:cytochrome c oxidase accessory protein FixG